MSSLKSKPRRRILIADDDAELRAILGLWLTGEGYDISQAKNGKEAVNLLARSPFDVFVTEIVMRDKDGFETLRELRQKPSPPKCIAMCGSSRMSSDLLLRIAQMIGAQCVLTKPFLPEQLLEAIRQVLGEN
jgi:two-component system response regulator CpxR